MLLANLRPVIRIVTAIAVLFALAGASSAGAATQEQVGYFQKPMYVTSAPNDPDRLFVVEREGRIVEVLDGVPSAFADLSSVVSCCNKERGLQSIALAPDFATSGRLFVFYTGGEGEIHVAELRASGTSAPLSSLRDLLVIQHPEDDNHYGGQLQFGPDEMLYISTGDGGGSRRQTQKRAEPRQPARQDPADRPAPPGLFPYTVPVGNPYPGLEAPFDTIWSIGLRNPYRFSFDRATGAMLIGDVGQSQREEVDYAPAPSAGAGVNYGWNCFEGTLVGPPAPATDPECATPPAGGYQPPIFDYAHVNPGGAEDCAIVGGYVVRDRGLGDLYGRYLYGDYCGSGLRSFSLAAPAATDRSEGIAVSQLISFGEDSCGRVYTAQESGRVSMLVGDEGASVCKEPEPRAASFVGIKAQGRRVKKGKRAQITAWVSPCAGRRGEKVKLVRGRTSLGTRRLDRVCSVRFRPKITRRANFRALVGEDENYVAAASRQLRIKILHRKSVRRHR